LEPPDAGANYTEHLVALPNLGCFYQPHSVVPVPPDFSALGIKDDRPLLLCCGTPFKYLPQHDRVLVRIARELGSCQLVFFDYTTPQLSDKLKLRLKRAFERDGADFARQAVFVPWQSRAHFYGLMRRADVFLDTIGFSGFNTAMQAVEAGLPIVASEGRFMRARLASGILKRMGLAELVTTSEDEYADLAVKLATNPEYRSQVRNRLEASRGILYEDRTPIRALEDFLLEVKSR
jgi:predicted O-linked N-acetylglucosamine transferase (SPINDLY family)